ncbi:MAG: hypothetical protein WC333_01960 [Dehalococcoidia bacterium]
MTHEQKINYMRIAAGMASLYFNNDQLDLLVSLYDTVIEKEGKTSVSDIVDVEFAVKTRKEERERKELSEKARKVGENS